MIKPRMRQVMRSTRYTVHGDYELRPINTPRLVWLCVGAGCYVYDESAEQAYARWQSKRARRMVEHNRTIRSGIACVKH